MRQSENITELLASLSVAQGEITNAAKGAYNPHFKTNYADLASVISAIREPFAKNGLAYMQFVTVKEKTVSIETMLGHKSGQFVAETLDLPLQQMTPQGVGSALTYGRRYSLMSLVGVAPEDDDGVAASKMAAAGASEPEKHDAPSITENDAKEAEKRALDFIEASKAAWAKLTTRAALAEWWKNPEQNMRSVYFAGNGDPLYDKFKAAFAEAGEKLPEESKPAEKSAEVKKADDLPAFNGDARPSESAIRMNMKMALTRCVNGDDVNGPLIQYVEPHEKSLSKPFVDEMYGLAMARRAELDK